MRCPICNCAVFYSRTRGLQWYDEKGNGNGHYVDKETKTVWCFGCGQKFDRKQIFKEQNGKK